VALLLGQPGSGAALDCFGFFLEILRPYAELISRLVPDRDPEQLSASLSFGSEILSVHGYLLPSYARTPDGKS